LATIDKYRQHLSRQLPSPKPWGQEIDQAEDFEIGHIIHLLQPVLSNELKAFLYRCKRMRNHLAHRRPVDDSDLLEAFKFWKYSGFISDNGLS
jgi:hypothetical protein